MKDQKHVALSDLCSYYEVEMSFFSELKNYGLLKVVSIEKRECIDEKSITDLEKMIRLHQDLNLNFEGIDTVFNMLEKIENLQSELFKIKNRLRRYEDI